MNSTDNRISIFKKDKGQRKLVDTHYSVIRFIQAKLDIF